MPWPHDERGSVLLLFPSAILVMLLLGAVAVDSSLAFLGERDLANASAAAANDVATQGLSSASFYREGAIALSDAESRSLAAEHVRAALGDSTRYRAVEVEVAVNGDEVEVRAAAQVRLLFAPSVPGAPDWLDIDATSTARAEERGD